MSDSEKLQKVREFLGDKRATLNNAFTTDALRARWEREARREECADGTVQGLLVTCALLIAERDACGIRSAEDERAAVVAIVRELEEGFRTTAHEHCGRGSASQEAFEISADVVADVVQVIERGEHLAGGSDGG